MRVSPHPPPIGALHHRRPRAGPDCGQLRGEPAVTGLDGSFATSPGSSDRIARQDRFGPPPPIQGASAYPGLDRPVSGLAAVTPGAFTPGPWPLAGLRASRFRSGSETLTSPRRQTPWPVIPDGRHDPAYLLSEKILRSPPSRRSIPFRPCPPIATQFQALFTPLPGYFSAFPRGTASAIGLGTYLGLEVGDPQLPAPYPRRGTQDPSPRILHPYAYGAITLYGPPFQASSASGARNWGRSYNPTSPVGFPTRFGLPSPLFPRRYSGDRNLLSLPAPTKMFPFGAFPLPAGSDEGLPPSGSPIRASPVLRLHAPRRGFSQLATPFLGARAEPSPGWLL